MDQPDLSRRRVAIIGGGISGLSVAQRLVELGEPCAITVLEDRARLGGVLETVHEDGYLFESGADNFITNVPWAVDLCRRMGFEDQLLQTGERHRGAFVVRRGRLRKIPQGFIIMAPSRTWPVVATPILGPLAKLRMAAEYFVPKRKDDSDESLAAFVVRRFCRQTYDRLVQPLIGGIYTGDPSKLSLQSTMPRFREMEKEHGSLIRAIMSQASKRPESDRNSSGGRYSMFVAPRDGVTSFIDAIAARLPTGSVQLNAPVTEIQQQPDNTWNVSIGGETPRTETFDAVVLATQARSASRILSDVDQPLSEQLGDIHHSGCAIVSLTYQRSDISHPLDGFGFVVPAVERRKIISGSFSSVKYAGRAPDGSCLIRVFIGGAMQQELVDLPDDQLREIAETELRELLGIRGDSNHARIARLPNTMPQYYVGHAQRVETIRDRAASKTGLFLTGNAFEGVGIPFCIRGGEQTAEQVRDFFNSEQGVA